jgi:hypothetical protein
MTRLSCWVTSTVAVRLGRSQSATLSDLGRELRHEHFLNTADESRGTLRFLYNSMDTSSQCFFLKVGIGKGRKHQERSRGREPFEHPGRFNAIHHRHHEVDHNSVGTEPLGFFNTVATILSLPTDSPISLLLK